MDGQKRVALQERNGCRGIVRAMDALRMHLGMTNAPTLTPVAESKLRSGFAVRKKFCKLLCSIECSSSSSDGGGSGGHRAVPMTWIRQLLLTFPTGYPDETGMQVELPDEEGGQEGDDAEDYRAERAAQLARLQGELEAVAAACTQSGRNGAGPAVAFVQAARTLLSALGPPITTVSASCGDGVPEGDATVFKMSRMLEGVEDDDEGEMEEGNDEGVEGEEVEEEEKKEEEGDDDEDDDDDEGEPLPHTYTCKKCRFTVLLERQRTHRRRRCEDPDNLTLSGLLFVDPDALPEWVAAAVAAAETRGACEGKLVCPGPGRVPGGGGSGSGCVLACGAKLGSWGWVGQTCSACKTWIAPAFSIVSNKVDKKVCVLSNSDKPVE